MAPTGTPPVTTVGVPAGAGVLVWPGTKDDHLSGVQRTDWGKSH